MRFRGIIICLLSVWGIFALGGIQNCSRSTRLNEVQPSLSSTDPSEASQAYWLEVSKLVVRYSQALITHPELQRKIGEIRSPANGRVSWKEISRSYNQAARANTEAVKEIEALPQDRVDPIALECVRTLSEFLILQAKLLSKNGEECSEMACLYAKAESDEMGTESKQFERQKSDLIDRMRQTASNEGAVEKLRLTELASKAKEAAAALSKKHRRHFPNLLGH